MLLDPFINVQMQFFPRNAQASEITRMPIRYHFYFTEIIRLFVFRLFVSSRIRFVLKIDLHTNLAELGLRHRIRTHSTAACPIQIDYRYLNCAFCLLSSVIPGRFGPETRAHARRGFS